MNSDSGDENDDDTYINSDDNKDDDDIIDDEDDNDNDDIIDDTDISDDITEINSVIDTNSDDKNDDDNTDKIYEPVNGKYIIPCVLKHSKKSVFGLKKKVNDLLELDKLPSDINITTITISCKCETEFKGKKISKYIDISTDEIISVSYGAKSNMKTNRISNYLKNKKKTNNKTCKLDKTSKTNKREFYNQVSSYVNVRHKDSPVHVMLFINGSIKMAGCKSNDDFIHTLLILFNALNNVKGVKHSSKKLIIDKTFVSNRNKLDISLVNNIKIGMINSGFELPFKINRVILYELLLRDNIMKCSYDPDKHSGIIIKYETEINNVTVKHATILVFESGKIIITGAKSCKYILDAYNFINKYILSNFNTIVKHNNNQNIMKYVDQLN